MNSLPDIFYANGAFLIYDEEHALRLRRQRIIGHHIGCTPKNPQQIVTSGLPYLINQYAAGIVFANKLANFKELKLKKVFSPEEHEVQYSKRLSRIQDEARRDFEEKRALEIRKRDLDISPSRMKQFDEKKLRLTIQKQPDTDCSSFEAVFMDPSNLLIFKDDKMIVFKDLYDRGFFVSSGMKFGSDFLVYPGDPVRYHAQYAVRVVVSTYDKVDITRLNYNEINALHRLCHTAKKTCLVAVIGHDSEQVNYWTLKDREYLTPDTSSSIFESIDPKLYPV